MPKPTEMFQQIINEQEALARGDTTSLGLPPELSHRSLLDGYSPVLSLTAFEFALSEFVFLAIKNKTLRHYPPDPNHILPTIIGQRSCEPTAITGFPKEQVEDLFHAVIEQNREYGILDMLAEGNVAGS